MSHLRIAPDPGYPTDTSGKPICRQCRGPITEKRRKTFCSAECVEEFNIRRSPAVVRRRLFERDHGICALCGLDTKQYDRNDLGGLKKDALDALTAHYGIGLVPRWVRIGLDEEWEPRVEKASTHHELSRWEADHIVAVSEGGGACGLDNYRTLCRACHVVVTGELRRRVPVERRGKTKPVMQLDMGVGSELP